MVEAREGPGKSADVHPLSHAPAAAWIGGPLFGSRAWGTHTKQHSQPIQAIQLAVRHTIHHARRAALPDPMLDSPICARARQTP